MKIAWNEDWRFTPDYEKGFALGEKVRIPHNAQDMSLNYCDENQYQMICGYEKHFQRDSSWEEKRVFVTFDGAAHNAEVYVNGVHVGGHSCGYTAFTVEMTDALQDGDNVLTVKLDTRETLNQPPFGYIIDYMTYGGLYREVWLEVQEEVYIQDIFVQAGQNQAGQNQSGQNQAGQNQAGQNQARQNIQVQLQVNGWEKVLAEKKVEVTVESVIWSINRQTGKLQDTVLKMGQKVILDQEGKGMYGLSMEHPIFWDIDCPQRYQLDARMILSDDMRSSVGVDATYSVIFGFRDMQFRRDGFYLNGRKVKIRGLNRHQCYPYMGYAAPASMQIEDTRILKEELGVNAVRTSHYPQSQHFLDACDDMGLLVFTEIPGWQHVGDAAWQEQAVVNCEEMIIQYRNHPSIMLWGVRINESTDQDALYTRTNEVAHRLDPSRMTSGVRYLEKSHLLEDVYAYNDFSYSGGDKCPLRPINKVTPDTTKPYLVSEYMGHMYPTKMWDCEEHRLEHALRHARVLEQMYIVSDISGCFGWCMFDYNTHKDFGSGDRICYHGVLDMYRNPKMAAAVYASQSDAKPILSLSSSMDIGEHPAGNIGDVYAFTNADSIRLYKNDVLVREYQAPESAMPHAPICIDDFIGELLETQDGYESSLAHKIKDCLNAVQKYGQESLPLRYKIKMAYLMMFHGFTMEKGVELFGKYVGNWGGEAVVYSVEAIKDGKVVQKLSKKPATRVHLKAKVSHTKLVERDTYDMASIRLEAVDEQDNHLSYYQEPMHIQVEGDIELVGPAVISMKGGATGIYIRSKEHGQWNSSGKGLVTVSGKDIQSVTVRFTVEHLN